MLTAYPSSLKSRKCWKYIFWFLFDTALVNAKICMNEYESHDHNKVGEANPTVVLREVLSAAPWNPQEAKITRRRISNLLNFLCSSVIFPRNYSAIPKHTADTVLLPAITCRGRHLRFCACLAYELGSQLNYQLGMQYSITVTTGWTEV